ncbi:hypothetical protein Q8A67_008493 [Cirrhinus molitorella]|uniref:Uncharacterized protein n=1 Tax=Cirrhinus molitorella TaxID=172907 RepID=A0AA88TNP9_9TELE|nr:hypothetical protein Q8A67_008493 [Cirrhinus molitorella]
MLKPGLEDGDICSEKDKSIFASLEIGRVLHRDLAGPETRRGEILSPNFSVFPLGLKRVSLPLDAARVTRETDHKPV